MSIESLIAKIKGTNNGYLFAPHADEITLAMSRPDIFKITKYYGEHFHTRIALA